MAAVQILWHGGGVLRTVVSKEDGPGIQTVGQLGYFCVEFACSLHLQSQGHSCCCSLAGYFKFAIGVNSCLSLCVSLVTDR